MQKKESITPGQAERWLAASNGNRAIQQPRVKSMVRDMRDGNWNEDNPDPIVLDREGHVLNGQHRLTALVAAKRTLDLFVLRGADSDLIQVIDSGKPRSFSDVLKIKGYTDVNTLAGAITWCWRYERGALNQADYPSHHELLHWFEANADDVVNAIQRARQVVKAIPCRFAIAAGVYVEAHRAGVDEDELEAFYVALETGADLEEGNPALKLREWLIGVAARRDKPPKIMYDALFIKALNAWLDGRQILSLRWRMVGPRREQFPVIGESIYE